LEAQTVFITGADKGLGFSLATRFVQEGFQVFAGQYGPETNLQELAGRFPEMLIPIPLDVSDMESVRQAAELVGQRTSLLDVLVNDAAIYPPDVRGSLEELDFTNAARTFDVNTLGPLRVTQQFYPMLKKGRRKLIVNISSEAGSIASCRRDREYIYCMSKSALNMQCKILQNYLRPLGFKIIAIQPGWMRTDMGGADADIHPDESAAGIFALATTKREPDDVIFMDYTGRPLPW